MEPVLEAAHFQLTRHCNLRCRFCGQARGVAAGHGDDNLPVAFWLDVAEQLKAMSLLPSPTVTLWGGEPLMYSHFDKLAKSLKEKDFRLGLITNGTPISPASASSAIFSGFVKMPRPGRERSHPSRISSAVTADTVHGATVNRRASSRTDGNFTDDVPAR